jgi:hypothetical protein
MISYWYVGDGILFRGSTLEVILYNRANGT